MMQTIPGQNITLRDLIDKFGLQLVEDSEFFPEWQANLPEITDSEKQQNVGRRGASLQSPSPRFGRGI